MLKRKCSHTSASHRSCTFSPVPPDPIRPARSSITSELLRPVTRRRRLGSVSASARGTDYHSHDRRSEYTLVSTDVY